MNKHQEPSLDNLISGYSEILAKDPHSTVFVSLSDAYVRTGRLDDALRITLVGVQALPWFCPGHVMLGKLHYQLGNPNEALRAFNRALTLDGESLSALKGLARIYLDKNRPEIARQILERALQVFPDNSSVRHLLSQLPSDEDDDETGPQIDDLAGEPSIATVTIAEVFVKQGLLPQACQVYRDILQAEPGNEAIRKKLEALEKTLAVAAEPAALEKVCDQENPMEIGGDALATLKRWLDRIRQRRQQHVP
jgi:tetratricopeptide (TPR) repeat protein